MKDKRICPGCQNEIEKGEEFNCHDCKCFYCKTCYTYHVCREIAAKCEEVSSDSVS